MTTAHVEKFAELVANDPELQARLGLDRVNADAGAASVSAPAFITNAVKEAKALGLEFTGGELNAFLDAEAKAAASGELSDTQLEAVAGGKAGGHSGGNIAVALWAKGSMQKGAGTKGLFRAFFTKPKR